jgi:hypothetical protein
MGRLCTLNGTDRMQRFDQVTELGQICGFEVVRERRSGAWRGSADAEEMTFRPLKVR